MFNSAYFLVFVAVYLRVKIFGVSLLHQWVTTPQGFGGSVQEFVLDFGPFPFASRLWDQIIHSDIFVP